MAQLIEEFIEKSAQAETDKEIFAIFLHALETLGYNRVVYSFVTDHPTASRRAGHGIKCNFPKSWMRHYLKKNYIDIDPVILNILQTRNPFTWQSLIDSGFANKAQAKILHEAEKAGLHHGVGIPLHGPRGEVAGLGVASSKYVKNLTIDRQLLATLQLLSEQFHLVHMELCTKEVDINALDIRFSKREMEIFKWWAADKSAMEIGAILACKEATVRFHIRNIYYKLEVNSRVHAVAKAIRLGLISPDVLNVEQAAVAKRAL